MSKRWNKQVKLTNLLEEYEIEDCFAELAYVDRHLSHFAGSLSRWASFKVVIIQTDGFEFYLLRNIIMNVPT